MQILLLLIRSLHTTVASKENGRNCPMFCKSDREELTQAGSKSTPSLPAFKVGRGSPTFLA